MWTNIQPPHSTPVIRWKVGIVPFYPADYDPASEHHMGTGSKAIRDTTGGGGLCEMEY